MAEPQYTATTIFPTWVVERTHTETPSGVPIETFNSRLRDQIMDLRRRDPEGTNRSNTAQCYHSKDVILNPGVLDASIQADLRQIFGLAASCLAHQYNLPAEDKIGWHMQAWSMIMTDGGYSTPHNHPNCHLSLVYYVDAGPAREADEKWMATGVKVRPGEFEALDVRGLNVKAPGFDLMSAFRLKPKSGQVIAFPSWLPHFVHPVIGSHERVCIACNATAVKHLKGNTNDTDQRTKAGNPRVDRHSGRGLSNAG